MNWINIVFLFPFVGFAMPVIARIRLLPIIARQIMVAALCVLSSLNHVFLIFPILASPLGALQDLPAWADVIMRVGLLLFPLGFLVSSMSRSLVIVNRASKERKTAGEQI